MSVNLIGIIVTYAIGVCIFYGVFSELYDKELLGDLSSFGFDFLVAVWPVTIAGFLIFFMVHWLKILGMFIGDTIYSAIEFIRNEDNL
jgi:hypothetical protein